MLPHLLEILLVGQEAIQSYYPLVQIILILNGSPLVIKQWGRTSSKTFTFPIKFTSAVYACAAVVMAQRDNLYERGISSVSTSAAAMFYESDSTGIIAVGK